MSKTGGGKKKKREKEKKKKRKCVAKKNVRIFFTSKLPVANKFHKFSSASRYRGRNEVWEEGSWFSMMFSAFVRRASFSWNIKMDDEEKKREREKKEERRERKKEEDRMVLTMWKFIDSWKMMSSDSSYPYIRTHCFLWWKGNILTWIYSFLRQLLLPFFGGGYMSIWRLV